MTCFFNGALEACPLPDWFVYAKPEYKKVVRFLGATATKGEGEFPRGLRLISNLTKDFSWVGFTKCIQRPEFNYVMMLNNYNNDKEFDITNSNIHELYWSLSDAKGNMFETTDLDVVIELEVMIISSS
jgi:hypothetical protein